jgi:hypothetical protein
MIRLRKAANGFYLAPMTNEEQISLPQSLNLLFQLCGAGLKVSQLVALLLDDGRGRFVGEVARERLIIC